MKRAGTLAWWPWLAAPAAGLAHAASIALPGSGRAAWWLQLTALAVLAWMAHGAADWKRAALQAWLFAAAWLAGTFWWLFISMHVYGGLAAPLAAAAVLALAMFLGGYYAFAVGLWRWLAPRSELASALAFMAVWLLAELMRARWFTGFPWGASGYAHVEGPLAALAPWVGVYGICAVAAAIAWSVAALVIAPRQRAAWALLAGLTVAIAAAHVGRPGSRPVGDPLPVTLLQGNIPQDEKFESRTGVPLALAWYAEQMDRAETPLVVAPETAIPLLPQQLPDGYLKSLVDRFVQGRQAALVGMPLGSLQEGYTNSIVGLRPGADAYRYDKHHLVPFGEFIPPLFRWFTDLMNIPLGDFNRGSVGQSSFEWQGQRLAPNVCYEDLFGEELAARFADAARAPTIFVNASNIGWFGNTVAIDQHLHITRMRALEFARPVLRATNTGATGIVDHQGRVTHLLERFTRGALVGEVRGQEGVTPFAAWASRWGLWPLWAIGVAPVLGALVRLRRRGAA